MTAAAIIAELAQQAWLKQAAKNIAGEYSDDLYQEFFVLLLEKPAEEIIKVYSNGYIKYYSVKIMGRIFRGRGLGSVNGFAKFLPQSQVAPFVSIPVDQTEMSARYCDYFDKFGVDDGAPAKGVRRSQFPDDAQQNESFDTVLAKQIEQEVLDSGYWYDVKLYQMWKGGKSMRSIYQETGIDFREVSAAIRRIKHEMQQKYYAS